MMDSVVMFEGSIYEKGYGLIAREVMRDPTVKYQAKVIYAYICSFAAQGNSGERQAFPGIDLQLGELGMSRESYFKYRKELVQKGYLKIEKFRSEKGTFENNLYKICMNPVPIEPKSETPQSEKPTMVPRSEKPTTVTPTSAKPTTVKPTTKSNSLKSNSLKSNKFNIHYDNISEVQAEIFRTMLRQYLFPEDEIENIIYHMEMDNKIPSKDILRKLCIEMSNDEEEELVAYNFIQRLAKEFQYANPKPKQNDIVAMDKEVDQLLKKLFPNGLHESKRKVIASLYAKYREEISIYQLQSILNGIPKLATRSFDSFYGYLNKVIQSHLNPVDPSPSKPKEEEKVEVQKSAYTEAELLEMFKVRN